MKKIMMGFVALTTITTVAMAENQTYYGAGLVIEEIEDFDNGMAFELSAGIVLDNNFGVEAKVSKTIVSGELEEEGYNTIETDVTTLSLFGTYTFQASPEFKIVPKVGFTNYSIELSNDGYSIDDSNMNISYGVDLKYSLNPKTTLYAGYTIFNPEFESDYGSVDFDSSHISFGVQQAF